MSAVQSVVFDSRKWTVARAIKWMIKHEFKHNKLDIKPEQLRFRQQPPGKFARYATKEIKNGTVKLIIGYPRGTAGVNTI